MPHASLLRECGITQGSRQGYCAEEHGELQHKLALLQAELRRGENEEAELRERLLRTVERNAALRREMEGMRRSTRVLQCTETEERTGVRCLEEAARGTLVARLNSNDVKVYNQAFAPAMKIFTVIEVAHCVARFAPSQFAAVNRICARTRLTVLLPRVRCWSDAECSKRLDELQEICSEGKYEIREMLWTVGLIGCDGQALEQKRHLWRRAMMAQYIWGQLEVELVDMRVEMAASVMRLRQETARIETALELPPSPLPPLSGPAPFIGLTPHGSIVPPPVPPPPQAPPGAAAAPPAAPPVAPPAVPPVAPQRDWDKILLWATGCGAVIATVGAFVRPMCRSVS